MFSNIKIITIELLFTSLNALMVYYSYQAQSSIYETSI